MAKQDKESQVDEPGHLGMYMARAKDFCADFDSGVKVNKARQNYRVENKHLVQIEIPKHLIPCLKTCLHQ